MSNNIAKIKVIGVGGGGGNAVAYMANSELNEVEFCILNTDKQAIEQFSNIDHKYSLGGELTKGLGAGADPSVGKKAAESDLDKIADLVDGSNMVFITAGMGGGTGTGAAPVIAECSKEKDILTIAVVTTPFSFEGKKRCNIAECGLSELREHVDSIIIIPNENLLQYLGANTKLTDAFNEANDVLFKAVKGVSELITKPGLINIDFADIKTIMENSGYSMMGIGVGSGANRAKEATDQALKSPLLDNLDVKGAKGLLVNVSASENMSLGDFQAVGDIVESYAGVDATIVIGTTINPALGDEIQVTVVATGLPEKENVNIDSGLSNGISDESLQSLFSEKNDTTLKPDTLKEKAPVEKNNDGFKIPLFMKKFKNP